MQRIFFSCNSILARSLAGANEVLPHLVVEPGTRGGAWNSASPGPLQSGPLHGRLRRAVQGSRTDSDAAEVKLSADRLFLLLGSLSGFTGVVLGAFAAHGLRGRLAAPMLDVFEVGVRYQLYHALALLFLGLALARWPRAEFSAAGWLFVFGTVVFSGSLYALSLSGMRWLGAVTPIGGLAFLLGWLGIAWGAWKG